MKKKGFTLVELLAVIVILAIIALIATPMILNVIDNAKKGAAESSAYGYVDAVEKSILEEELKGNIKDKNKVYVISELGFVNIKGDKPTEGWVKLEKGVVVAYSLKIGNYIVNNEDGEAVAEKGDTVKDIPKVCKLSNDIDGNGLADISDEITCGTESFYVYSNDGTNIKMLSKYNLNISKGIQSVDFSDKLQYSSGSSTYEDSSIKNYVDEYKKYLESYEIVIKESTLITKEDIETLAGKTLAGGNKIIDIVPSFIYSTSYWTRTIDNSIRVFRIDPSGGIYTDFCTEPTGTGLRPVIIIPSTEI